MPKRQAKPAPTPAQWLYEQLATLERIFGELAYGVREGIVEEWPQRALYHRVQRLLPAVKQLCDTAGLPVEMESGDKRPRGRRA